MTSQINALSAIPVQPLLPYVARYAHDMSAHLRELQLLVAGAIRVNGVVALGLSGLVLVCAPAIAAVLVQPDDVAAVISTMRILAVIYGVYSLNAVGFYSLFATHDVRRLCLITVGSGLLTLATIALGARLAGLTGAAIGNASYVATLALTMVAIRRFGLPVGSWLRMLLVPVGAWAAAVVIAVTFDGMAVASIPATLLLLGMMAWAFTARSSGHGAAVWMKGAPTHE
jgi:O-antigen/teichoic acid export membrane protein